LVLVQNIESLLFFLFSPEGDLPRWWLVGYALLNSAIVFFYKKETKQFYYFGLTVTTILWIYLGKTKLSQPELLFPPLGVPIFFVLLLLPASIGAALLAWFVIGQIKPKIYTEFRTAVVNHLIYTPLYLHLLKGEELTPPRLSREKYSKQKKIKLVPYGQTHPSCDPISIKAADYVPHTTGFATVKTFFKFLKLVDTHLPLSRTSVPIIKKTRLDSEESWTNYWPEFVPNRPETPPSLQEAAKKGQALAWFAQFGHATTLVKRDDDKIVMDLSHLANYEVKPDYKKYGGKAFFKYENDTLVLKSVIAPGGTEEIEVDPHSQAFKNAQQQLIASTYAEVVIGKHLCGIHAYYNLIAIAMHNNYDTDQHPYLQPLRLLLHIHFFNHITVEELSTPRLLTPTGIFSQIFAFTYPALARYVNDTFDNMRFGVDEDFDAREKVFHGSVPEKSQLHWEKQYHHIFKKYAENCVKAIYHDEDAYVSDKSLQGFFNELAEALPNSLAHRYKFEHPSGLVHFLADAIYHLVVRHEIYGTLSTAYALDTSIGITQVPVDARPLPQEEVLTQVWINIINSRVRFSPLRPFTNFRSLLNELTDKQRDSLKPVFEELDKDLLELEEKWKKDPQYNEHYLRPLPSSLETGAGY
jgi:hypothetical protein